MFRSLCCRAQQARRRPAPSQTTKAKGDALELRVARVLARSGAWRVRRNVILRDRHGHASQIDVCCGLFSVRYYECKNVARPVGLEDVAKFKSVLELNGIPASRGTVVTAGRFSPRCATIGIACIDGEGLCSWERHARWTWGARRAAVLLVLVLLVSAGLEAAPMIAAALRGSALEGALREMGWPGAPDSLLAWHDMWLRCKAALSR